MNPFVEALERAERLIAERNAEIERLRAALRKIADGHTYGDAEAWDALVIARRALEEK